MTSFHPAVTSVHPGSGVTSVHSGVTSVHSGSGSVQIVETLHSPTPRDQVEIFREGEEFGDDVEVIQIF